MGCVNTVGYLLFLVLFQSGPGASSPEGSEAIDHRLPQTTQPLHYDVKLVTNIHEGDITFMGVVTILLTATEDTSAIVLNSKGLQINEASIQADPPGESYVLSHAQEDKNTLRLSDNGDEPITFQEGTTWSLTIAYNGTLQKDNMGFYAIAYKDHDNTTRYMAATHFEKAFARLAFPCYDEPDKVATFSIVIDHDASYNAVSNMPIKVSTNSDNRNVTAFETTPKMSTYLVGFVLCHYTWSEGSFASLSERIHSQHGSEDKRLAPLLTRMAVYKYLRTYLAVEPPIRSMDVVAIGGRRDPTLSLGLVTASDVQLLWTSNSSFRRKYTATSYVAYQYAAQWFEGTVPLRW